MKTEELQMILNALQSVGDGAKDAFFWWLFFDKALPVIGWLLTAACILTIVRLIIGAVAAHETSVSVIKKYRNHFGIGGGWLHEEEIRAVERRIDEMIAKQGEKE